MKVDLSAPGEMIELPIETEPDSGEKWFLSNPSHRATTTLVNQMQVVNVKPKSKKNPDGKNRFRFTKRAKRIMKVFKAFQFDPIQRKAIIKYKAHECVPEVEYGKQFRIPQDE